MHEHVFKMPTSGWEREVDSSCRGGGLGFATGCDDDGRDAGRLFCVKHTWSAGIGDGRLSERQTEGEVPFRQAPCSDGRQAARVGLLHQSELEQEPSSSWQEEAPSP